MAKPRFCCVFLALMTIVQLDCVIGNMRGLRLRGGQTPNEGRVEVQRNRRWFAVCEKNWDDHDSNAACRQLRYPDGGSRGTIRRGRLSFFHRKFNCNEGDSFLSDCKTGGVSCGRRRKAAKVICRGDRLSTTTTTTTSLSSGPGHDQTVVLNQTDGSLYSTTTVPDPTMGTWTELTTSLEDEYATTQGQVEDAQGTTTAGQKGQSSSQKRTQQFPIVTVAAAVGTVLGLLLLLAVFLFFFCRRRARSKEDNMTSKLKEDTDQVGMGELGIAQHDDSEKTYHTIQDPAVNNKVLPVIPTAPPSEHDENYSTIPDVQSSPTGGRVDERAPAPPPSQTDVYYSVVRDNDTVSPADQTGTSGTATTTQEPEYAVVKKASKRKENKEESDQGTGAPGPEYAVVNKNHKKDPKTEGKGNNQSGTVDNVIYERY